MVLQRHGPGGLRIYHGTTRGQPVPALDSTPHLPRALDLERAAADEAFDLPVQSRFGHIRERRAQSRGGEHPGQMHGVDEAQADGMKQEVDARGLT